MDRVRPSFMTKEQLDKYMSDVKQNRQPRPRPNFELPAKRLSMTFNDPPPEPQEKEEPKPEPIFRVQTDSPVSAFRRYGGSVRDIQKSKGTVRTRNGWIIGDSSGKPSSPFSGNRQGAQSRIVEEPETTTRVKKVEEMKPSPVVAQVKADDKENQADWDSDSPLEESLEDSIIKLQNDISQEIEAVSILLDSPIDESGDGASGDVDDILDSYRDDPKPDSPAPLKITRSLPVDIKHTLAIHQSQLPEPPVSITNTNKIGQYQVNSPPTPSSTPPELEKRPKFGDRGVPTFSSVAPPTPPTKVMIVEDDKLVAEMTLDDGKGDAGYNVQQGNPNAVVPSAEVSKIAGKISELQMKADPWAAAPKPAFPNISMEEFQERNEPHSEHRPSQLSFNRTNSLPVGMSQDSTNAAASNKKSFEPQQYKPYRPPTQPASLPSTVPRPAFMRTRTGSESVITPPVCPSPAPHVGAIPSHMNNAHGRHSSLGNIYQPNQPPIMAAYAATQNFVPLQHRHSMSTNVGYGQIQPMRHFNAGPPPPTHSQHRPGPQNHFNRQFHGSFGPSGHMNQPTVSRMLSNVGTSGRSLPVLPTDLSKALPEPPTTNIINDPQVPPKQSPSATGAPPVKNQTPPPIPTFSFDDTPTSGSRRLPAVPTQPQSKPLPTMTTRSFEDRKQPETKAMPPVPVFSFSDDSTPSSKSIPSINIPDDNASKPSVPIINVSDDDDNDKTSSSIPSFSFSGPDEQTDRRPLPTAPTTQKQDSRPLPSPRKNSIADRRAAFETHGHGANHRIPLPRSAASCTACGQHISARAVSASGLRFHPECFRCSHCSTRLEHVAFYPEPLAPGAGPDTQLTGRFFCHLDFHELFSPRCKSCKTPIEGEVVEACGATWHPGHFFCAECGDPFDAKSRFVEKDKYAWCLCCYQKRYSSKCKKCKKPVTDTVVKALDADWHMECFCCFECGSEFQDGRYFLRGGCDNEPVCTKCEETRLKSWELVQ
ncbi:hypothetical protein TWF225_009817 [Orbilia oligospora]|nr:hypothetical protein TWF225_009817 [Orbilia oligospora]KAF3245196.1 hypothetical protein TWF217_010532 [Orbilia oligospora]KAF3255584.1 hypothetical protein TWF128_005578 [Orbilia oligospora]